MAALETGTLSLVQFLLLCLASCGVRGQMEVDQSALDKMAESLKVTWTVVTNTKEVERFEATMGLENEGDLTIEQGNWTLYFYSVFPLEPERLMRPGLSIELDGQGLVLTHIVGMLFSLTPTPGFRPLGPAGSRVLRMKGRFWSVSRSDVFPNWYLAGPPGTESRIIASTAGDDPAFVTQAREPQQQKRYDFDLYQARSAQERYHRNHVPYEEGEEVRVVPKPWMMAVEEGRDVTLSAGWQVWDDSPGRVLANEVTFAVDNLGVTAAAGAQAPTTNAIILNLGNIIIADGDVMSDDDDAYSVLMDDVNGVISVTGRGASGVFYGLQSLRSLLRADGSIPKVTVHDAPRFPFRSLYMDLSRNFRSREELERLMPVMASYKLNKLHLHLADDEGWRIEIAGLPELTQIGARRCHDPEETECLLPQLGSGPFSNNSGSGYLSASDYQAILRLANTLHIEVIPEIDMPGHARAAIKAMEARYRTYMSQSNQAEAERYRLIDSDDDSVYISPQAFNDNAINVCLDSTYAFVTKVVQELKRLHENIQDLHEFHSGFDEVGRGAWVNSTVCQQLQTVNPVANYSLKEYFFTRVAEITHAEGLALGAWEDGLMLTGNQPFNRSLAPNSEVYANVWDNVWEWGTASRTHTLANMGYKVVMSHGTILYFDHPYEPHWEERGYYWATRFTDAQKTFGFMPLDYYGNIDERRSGEPISREEVCGQDDVNCPPLERPENIVGMQGHLWSETVRTLDQVDSQLFPRVLALAERAWHFAPWEKESNATLRQQLRMEDWYSFARTVGHRELPRLDALGIRYRIPPPGAMVERQKLLVASGYPGLAVEYSTDCGATWQLTDGTERVTESQNVLLRSRSADGQRYSRVVSLSPIPAPPATPQPMLDYMSNNLDVLFEVTDNYELYGTSAYVITMTLNNTGTQPITTGNWEIQFSNVLWIHSDTLIEGREYILQEHKMAVSHVQGYLFRLTPLFDFPPLEGGTAREIVLKADAWSVSRTDQFPNYFVAADGANARVIVSTAGESLSFVKPFNRVNQWKRDSTDRFDPWTPSARYGKQSDVSDLGSAPHPYLPTPKSFTMDRSKSVSFASGWVIVAPDGWSEVANFLKDNLEGADLTMQQDLPASRYIQLRMSSDGVPQSDIPGAYSLQVNPEEETIVITATNTTGALYGVQSLINMALQSEGGATVFKVMAADAPRFPFRGMFLDVSRNFHDKESVLKLLRLMGLYKLNRFHMHLADDEGWRLEIPGLPELTTVGSTRCHDPTEELCLTPVMGSGPDPENSGTGFFTVQDYKEILQFAAQRHIEVIPEFDMPGHARAAIKAMAQRRRMKTEAGDVLGAHEYELDEYGDQSVYSSIQLYNDDAVNPCMESSYRFIRHVMQEVKAMHADINPLRTYHFGGDEVASGAWMNSKACSDLVRNNTDLKFLFSTRVAAIAADLGLNLGGWEDGMVDHGDPIPREDMRPVEVYANAWQNVWEWGAASRAYNLANAGYRVIMSQATHTYLDHPHEPNPEERGFYWATRYTDIRKAFLFQPQNLWSNVEITRFGDRITLSEVCGDDNSGCPQLVREENVVGMQGQLWSETVRTAEQMDYMIFPRLLALAERAWHRAEWEGRVGGPGRDGLRDWTNFANSLGYGQLRVLDRLGVAYRVGPPGARAEGRDLMINTEFPGLRTQYMTSPSQGWRDVGNGKLTFNNGQTVHVRARSADGQRYSESVMVTFTKDEVSSGAAHPQHAVTFTLTSVCIGVVMILVAFV